MPWTCTIKSVEFIHSLHKKIIRNITLNLHYHLNIKGLHTLQINQETKILLLHNA